MKNYISGDKLGIDSRFNIPVEQLTNKNQKRLKKERNKRDKKNNSMIEFNENW